jgi:RNA polymerase sigma-B factor
MKAQGHGWTRETQASDRELLITVRSRPPGDPERQAACEALVARHDLIVRLAVAHYSHWPDLTEDLMQVGYLGLMRAINNFDPALGESLPAYARPCVTGEIKRYFRDKRWQIRVQRTSQELRLRIRAATDELTQQLARTPTAGELAEHLEVSEEEIVAAQFASQVFQVDSLDAPAGPDDDMASLGDLIGAEDAGLDLAVDMEAVWKHWAELPPREQRLLMLRFYGNMNQSQIGEELGISQMHVSRLLRHALGYLREKLTEDSQAPQSPVATTNGESGPAFSTVRGSAA